MSVMATETEQVKLRKAALHASIALIKAQRFPLFADERYEVLEWRAAGTAQAYADLLAESAIKVAVEIGTAAVRYLDAPHTERMAVWQQISTSRESD